MNGADRVKPPAGPSKREEPVGSYRGSGGMRRATGGMRRATGRARDEWFTMLDAWGAAGRPYREIADWLTGEHGLSGWWAQKLIVEYEQARGIRPPGVRRDGTFEVGASKTVGVPVERLFEAFTDPRARERWLPDAVVRDLASEQHRQIRFQWQEGPTRVVVSLSPRGETKSQVDLLHQRLADAATAADRKVYWRERLIELKRTLEGE